MIATAHASLRTLNTAPATQKIRREAAEIRRTWTKQELQQRRQQAALMQSLLWEAVLPTEQCTADCN